MKKFNDGGFKTELDNLLEISFNKEVDLHILIIFYLI